MRKRQSTKFFDLGGGSRGARKLDSPRRTAKVDAVAFDPRALFDSDETGWLEKPDRDVEGEQIERKQTFDPKEVARQVSAMANAEGGLIVVGVTSDGHVAGLGSQAGTVRERLSKIPIETCDFKHRFVPIAGGDSEILYILVPRITDRVVCASDGRAYQRKGSNTVELSTAEILELRYTRGEKSFEDRPVVRYLLEQLDPAVAKAFMDGLLQRNGLSMPLTIDEALANKRLTVVVDNETHLTVAGLISLGKQPTDFVPGARIHFVKIDGREERFGAERNVVKERWFDGPTLQILEQIREFLRTLVSEFDYLGPDGTFVTEPEYPELAWDEALVNALVHRSYSLDKAHIEVRMFDDRLEVESPGGYPGAVRPDGDGVFPLSYPRNPRLAEALRYLSLVRLAKEGTRRMKAEMDKLGLPSPAFQEIQGVAVKVTLRNDIDRRRPRAEIESQKESWRKVAAQLGSDLAVYRSNAYESWARLHSLRARAPAEVIEAADTILRDPAIAIDEKSRLTRIMVQEETPAMDAWAGGFAEGLGRARPPHTDYQVAQILAHSEDVLETILTMLERGQIRTEEGRSLAFSALDHRYTRRDLPPEDWTKRVLAACWEPQSASWYPESATLYYRITGKPLPKGVAGGDANSG